MHDKRIGTKGSGSRCVDTIMFCILFAGTIPFLLVILLAVCVGEWVSWAGQVKPLKGLPGCLPSHGWLASHDHDRLMV